MREIKFRAWIIERPIEKSWMHYFDFSENRADTLDSKNIMQGTGVKDANGIEIYEGDILTHRFSDEVKYGKYIVQFSEYNFSENGVGTSTIGFWLEAIEGIDEGLLDSKHSLEIIGNIYQKPELLNNGNMPQ